MTSSMLDQFYAARRRSVPVVVIRTADQSATAESLYLKLRAEREASKSSKPEGMVTWDAVRGVVPFNAKDPDDVAASQGVYGKGGSPDETINFVEAMSRAVAIPERSVVVAYNAHRQLYSSEPMGAAAAVQAVHNIRDRFKLNMRMLVLLAPFFAAPPELEQDIVVLDDPLPEPAELGKLVSELHETGGASMPDESTLAKAVSALSGLSMFGAEQVTSMSLSKQGLDLDALWQRKRVTIEQTRGLRVYRGTERFSDVYGLENIKARLMQRLQAKTPVGVVVFMDEIDKSMANVEHDTTGVRMDQVRTLLTEMEDNRWHGLTLVGVPGGGKSMLAKAFGNEAGVPTVMLDLGDMEGPHVGESEAMLRTAIKVIKAVGRGNAFFVATSNNATVMRPELQRRFTKGTFFVDLPTAEEREAVWRMYCAKYAVDPDQPRPSDEGWTPAEIRNCVEEAWDSGISLVESGKFIISMAQSRAHEIEAMRAAAHMRYLSASEPGYYDARRQSAVVRELLRRFELPDEPDKVM